MTWHYQCMRHKGDKDSDDWYGVHELYIGGGKESYTVNDVAPSADSPEDLIEILENMIKDIKKYGVKDYDA